MGKSFLAIRNSCRVLWLTMIFINPLLYAEETGKVTQAPVVYQPYIIMDSGSDKLYGISKEGGFLVGNAGAAAGSFTWLQQNQGLPLKKVYPFNQNVYHYLTAFNFDPANPGRLAVTTASELYASEDGGLTWENIPMGSPISRADYLTSVALSPFDKNTYLVGSSFQAMYETKDRGKTWTSLADRVSFLYKGAGFYEEMSAIAYSPLQPNKFMMGSSFLNVVYYTVEGKQGWQTLTLPWQRKDEFMLSMNLSKKPPKPDEQVAATNSPNPSGTAKPTGTGKAAGNNKATAESDKPDTSLNSVLMEIATTKSIWVYDFETSTWLKKRDLQKIIATDDLSGNPEKLARLNKAAGKQALYINSVNAYGAKLDKHIQFMKVNGLNAMVVDLKDDQGLITYASKVDVVLKMKSAVDRIDVPELIKKTHENGIYLIARLVTFKDNLLHRYDNYKYALWDGKLKKSWDNTREFWVDPYSPFVWEYNIKIAKELELAGVDEIQFDYIRFPTDGDVQNIVYRYKMPEMSKIDALESFVKRARDELSVPISTDFYGYNCWYRMGNWIGQNIEMLSQYLDAICPMYYPSHFPLDFLSRLTYLDRAKVIYDDGSNRAYFNTRGRSLIRPYVQAFLLGKETVTYKDRAPEYLRRQMEGLALGNASGFTLWNQLNRYYMVTDEFKTLLAKK